MTRVHRFLDRLPAPVLRHQARAVDGPSPFACKEERVWTRAAQEIRHVQRAEETTQEDAEAQAQEASQTAEVPAPPELGAARSEPEVHVAEGKKIKIRVRTVNGTYEGEFVIPPMRNRVSDVLNEEQRLFINLTNVIIDGKERADFVSLNKNLIESIMQLS